MIANTNFNFNFKNNCEIVGSDIDNRGAGLHLEHTNKQIFIV